MKRKGKVIERW